MKAIRLLLSTAALSALICGLALVWNEDKVTCGTTTAKLFETMFIFVALGLIREVAKLK